MSFNSNKIFEKASRLADCASDTIKDISREAEAFAHVKLQNALNSVGVVNAEEFEAIKCMVSKINDEVSYTQKRLDKIEKNISDLQNISTNDEVSSMQKRLDEIEKNISDLQNTSTNDEVSSMQKHLDKIEKNISDLQNISTNDEVSSMQKRLDKIEKNISDLQNISTNDEKSI